MCVLLYNVICNNLKKKIHLNINSKCYCNKYLFYWASLQHAGRNPSQKTINKYWTPQTAKLNFDDFCIILRKEKPTSKAELLKSFKQLDVNDDGCILHTDLYKLLTKVRAVKQFCNMHIL